MKSKFIIELLMGTIVILAASGIAWAGETLTFSMSCSIPAVPGVNAPPFPEKQAATSQADTTTEQLTQNNLAKEDETSSEASGMIQEEIMLAEGRAIEIIYSR